MLKIILLLLLFLVATLKYAPQLASDVPLLPQTRSFPLPPIPLIPQLPSPSASLQNISSWLLSSLPNIENLNDGIQQVLSTKNHPSNNFQMMTYEEEHEEQDQQQLTVLDDDDYQEVVDDRSTLKNDFCRSPQCVISASKMDYLIDWKVDPCENFYNFACGSFIRDSTLHDRRDSLNVFTMTDDKLKDQLRRLFTRKIVDDEIEPYKMVKRLFTSCMDVDDADKRGVEPFRKLIDAVGGWPMLDGDWDEKAWDLEDSIMKLREYVGQNNFRQIFQLRKFIQIPWLGIIKSQDKLTNELNEVINNDTSKTEIIFKAYKSYLIDTATIVGANPNKISRDIDDAVEFQRDLILLNSRYESSPLDNSFALFQNENYINYAVTQWLDIFQPLPLLAKIKGNEKKLNARAFFAAFEELMTKTSKRTLANYFVLRILVFSSRYMTSELKKRSLVYRMELLGVKQKEELWKQCVDIVSNSMQLAAESLFSQEYFNLESKQTAIDIAMRVKSEFDRKLNNEYSWMDIGERLKIFTKMNEIILKLRFPKELLSDSQVNFFYRTVSNKLEKYFESILKLTVFNTERRFLILQSGLSSDYSESAGVLNYADTSSFNKILFPAGILQKEVLSPESPLYLNFPTSGFLIGYIFAQNFEIFQQSHLPSNVSSQIGCLIRQYDSYKDLETGIKNNGRNTLQGNIADNGSLKAVYTAYKKWILENGREKSLPALKFSNEQFFWISFAQLFCSISRPEKIKNLNEINSNSFEQFRVIGALSNSRDFANDFKCKRDSLMNPSTKCNI
ncbi:hypothetical protein ACKWTF_007877 [Chironomus riparius]